MTQPPDARLPAHIVLDEPSLRFGSDSEALDVHPLRGLLTYGPFSRNVMASYKTQVRCAAIFPADDLDALQGLVRELWTTQRPRERKAYLPDYPGYKSIFGVEITGAAKHCQVQLPVELDAKLESASHPHRVLADTLAGALQTLAQHQNDFDVVLIYLPNRWRSGFEGPKGDDFDLHDYIKTVAAGHRMATQVLNDDALTYKCRASVMWRLSIALYVKAGGVPWKLADPEPDSAYVGLSYALRGEPADRGRFVTCCSQVFDADGSGLEFLVYRPDKAFEGRNPFLTREQMRTVMFRSKALYQARHAGRLPRRVVVHKNSFWRNVEIDGCRDAWSGVTELDLAHVQQNVGWRGVLIKPNPDRSMTKGVPDGYPVQRGTVVQVGGHDALLWTQGNAPSATDGRDFFKEGRGIPRPLLISRYAGDGPLERMCRDVLLLTKMNWNNDGLYDLLPTTLSLAHSLAETAKRMPQLSADAYPYRLFM